MLACFMCPVSLAMLATTVTLIGIVIKYRLG